MEGQQLGNYRILQKLGEGGMGSVYLARDLSLERDVAIKVIAPHLAQNPSLMTRFKVEAIAQARLNHPNIITIHAFDQQQDYYYIVMEYMEGQTLKSLLKERGTLPVAQALAIISRILDGLIYAHGRGVLHRDIKPANIFITRSQEVKIGDFGIAKVEGINGLTRVGSPLGTPLYSSPEQILGQPVTVSADIYSAGVTLYEMLTGATPFKSGTGNPFEIQKAHLEKTPAKPSQLNPNLPPYLDIALMKALAKSPAQRFPSAQTFKEALIPCGAEPPNALKITPKPLTHTPLPHLKKLPPLPLQALKKLSARIKMPRINPALTPAAQVVQDKIVKPIKTLDRRKWWLVAILIPLLILLFIAIAHAQHHPAGPENTPPTLTPSLNNHELIINFQAKTSSCTSSCTSRRNK